MTLLLSLAFAQDYAFPTSSADYGSFYQTSYLDHGGSTDWACGSDAYAGHNGSDFGAGSWSGMAAGRDVTAAAAGQVVYVHDGERDNCANDCSSPANAVQIAHPDGRVTVYAHLKKWSVTVDVGDAVSCGDKLGEMGSSGNSSAPHLHFGVYQGGNLVEPFAGSCGASSSSWTSQGAYQGLPSRQCDNSYGGSGGGTGCQTAPGWLGLGLLLLPFVRRR